MCNEFDSGLLLGYIWNQFRAVLGQETIKLNWQIFSKLVIQLDSCEEWETLKINVAEGKLYKIVSVLCLSLVGALSGARITPNRFTVKVRKLEAGRSFHDTNQMRLQSGNGGSRDHTFQRLY